MIKISTITVIGILIISGLGAVASHESMDGYNSVDSSNHFKIVIPVSLPTIDKYQIVDSRLGQKIEIDNFGYLKNPGKPLLPSNNVLVALPPGGKMESIDVDGIGAKKLPGSYQIVPTPQILSQVDSNDCADYVTSINEEWSKQYNLSYSSDNPYPSKVGKVVGKGSLRKYSYVSVSICPFRYHPSSGRLYYFESAKIVIDYSLPSVESFETQSIEQSKKDTLGDEQASELFVNYDEIKDLYKPKEVTSKPLLQAYDYVIITTNDLSGAITFSDFVDWKTSIGYSVKIVHITEDEITSQPGHDLAEQIRNFLRSYYIEWGIKYVLLVGDYETIPMRYCYPDPTNHRFEPFDFTSGEVPTDH